jgi:uncharacterized protein YndB with AHSA1/START domain
VAASTRHDRSNAGAYVPRGRHLPHAADSQRRATHARKTSEDADEVEVRFVRLVPHERIEQAVTFESDDPAFSGEMRIVWILDSVQEGTLVTVRCENVPAGIEAEDHQAGLKSTLSNLTAFAERGT